MLKYCDAIEPMRNTQLGNRLSAGFFADPLPASGIQVTEKEDLVHCIRRCMLICTTFLLMFSFVKANSNSQPLVLTEHIREGWNFQRITAPSRSDAALNSVISISGNKPAQSCLSPDGMHIGVLPQKNRLLRDFFCFTNDNALGGNIVMDLGSVIPVAMVCSYSAHGPVGGTTWCNEFDGSRGPQVYTLYGSSVEKPEFSDLRGADWALITKVDTRPDDTESDWQGTYGVNIKTSNNSLLGHFRWLVWEVESTFKADTKHEWTDTWYCELDVHTPESLVNAGDAIMAGTQLDEIILAFKSHFDIGFTHPAPEIVDAYRTTMIDNALDLIEESYQQPAHRRFAWTIPSWVAYQILWEGQDSQRRERIVKAMQQGSLIVHGLPVTLQTESLEPEDLVFSLSMNRKVSKEAGIPMSRSGKMTDVPSHSWILPTVLKNAGLDFLHLGVNPCNERPDVPLLYYWQGPDGSRLLTMHTQGYGSDTEFGHGLYPPKDWPYKHWLALIVATDNAGPPTQKEFGRLFTEAENNLPGVNIRQGKMEDFADAIFKEEEHGASIPVVIADMPDCWIHGFGTMPNEESIARSSRRKLSAAGWLDFHLRSWGLPRSDLRRSVFQARERSLMYGEHTWGGARNLEGRNVYTIDNFDEFIRTDKNSLWLERTWQDHADYIHQSQRINDSLTLQAMQQLADNVNMQGERLVVYNPLPWVRDALVELPGKAGRKFMARQIPPSGYKVFALEEPGAEQIISENSDRAELENGYFVITVDRVKGGVVSVINRLTGRELVDRNVPHAFGQYYYERYDREQNQAYHLGCSHLNTVYGSNGRCVSGWNIRADLPDTPAYQSAVPEYQVMQILQTSIGKEIILRSKASGLIRSDVTTTISLADDCPWFEIKVELSNKEPDYWPESGSIYLPVNAPNPQFRIGRLGAVVDPAADFAVGSNRTYGYVNTGAIIGDEWGKGLAICPLDQGIMSFGDKGLCSIDPDYVPDKPLAKVSMFNNLWSINFPYWIKGSVSSRVRIWATENMNDTSLVIPAAEARNPVLAGYSEKSAGRLPVQKSGIEVSRKGIYTSVDRSESNEVILLLWEQTGIPGGVTVTLPAGMLYSQAIPVNLNYQVKGEPVPVSSGRLELVMGAYAPSAFILK
jgi:alpha-mannosidase